MQCREREIVVLKPTPVFLSFLREQRPDLELPSLGELRSNTTAYSLPRHETDEILLSEIERNYISMFHHEIKRVLNDIDVVDIQGSFLEFLCCFKFEIYAGVVVIESSIEEGRQVLSIKPKTNLLKWIQNNIDDNELIDVLERISLAHLAENSNSEVNCFLNQHYRSIYRAEMMRMSDIKTPWPEISAYGDFERYFEVDLHHELIHLN